MPNIKSAKKRLKTSEEARQRNVAVRTQIKNARRTYFEAIDAKDKSASEEAFKSYCSILDKAQKKGVIVKNTATRRKARAADKLRLVMA